MAGISDRWCRRRPMWQAGAILLTLSSVWTACGSGVLYAPWSPETQSGWTQAAGDASGDGLLIDGLEPPLRLRWQQEVDKPPLGSPLIAGPLLLQWSKAPDLYVFDVISGTRVGKRSSDDPVCGPPALAGGGGRIMLVSILEDPSQLRAIDLESGDIVWRQEGALCAAVVVRGDTVYAAMESGKMRALAAADGRVLWTLDLEAPLTGAPSLAGDVLYIADGAGDLVAASIDSGHVLWRRDLGSPVRSRPTVDIDEGRVLAAIDGRLHALAAETGESLWWAEFDGLPSLGLYVSSTQVAVGSTDQSLYAFDLATGQPLWRCVTEGIVRGAPVGTASTIYLGAGDGWLHAVDTTDGSMRWQQQLDGPVLTSVALTRQRLAVTTERGTTYVFSR
ncbi:MAG TPA: PQQ-binding-like beta-propeller repeat protein [Candidatus Latescibacteria bacterium]|nr:PQQ-binding-like beta-propeller repeat protein [Candidatus Latescibacterota bacterium]HJP32331.1 PQQ-binding-like beta-propeller repeat protein [Candidatus Latescibacterota bacterium]